MKLKYDERSLALHEHETVECKNLYTGTRQEEVSTL